MPEGAGAVRNRHSPTWCDLRKTSVTCERHGTRGSGKHGIRVGTDGEVSAAMARARAEAYEAPLGEDLQARLR
ncbi:hypothetical protein TPCG7_17340 [Cutibacterium granulosum]|nr:hypothetical protein TPCG7_17340 [Cutibacterium granulosum]